jgi:uncharacterized membrane protein
MKGILSSRAVKGVSPLGRKHEKKKAPIGGGIQLQGSIRVKASPQESYSYWRNFKNLPSFMNHLESVVVLDDRRSHWLVKGPADTTSEWDAEIIKDVPGKRISWRSLENAQIDNAGSVSFVPLKKGQETEVKIAMTYNAPLGPIGNILGKLLGEHPKDQIAEDLGRFKDAVEQKKHPVKGGLTSASR